MARRALGVNASLTASSLATGSRMSGLSRVRQFEYAQPSTVATRPAPSAVTLRRATAAARRRARCSSLGGAAARAKDLAGVPALVCSQRAAILTRHANARRPRPSPRRCDDALFADPQHSPRRTSSRAVGALHHPPISHLPQRLRADGNLAQLPDPAPIGTESTACLRGSHRSAPSAVQANRQCSVRAGGPGGLDASNAVRFAVASTRCAMRLCSARVGGRASHRDAPPATSTAAPADHVNARGDRRLRLHLRFLRVSACTPVRARQRARRAHRAREGARVVGAAAAPPDAWRASSTNRWTSSPSPLPRRLAISNVAERRAPL